MRVTAPCERPCVPRVTATLLALALLAACSSTESADVADATSTTTSIASLRDTVPELQPAITTTSTTPAPPTTAPPSTVAPEPVTLADGVPTEVDPRAGFVFEADGVSLDVPPGALAEPATVTVEVVRRAGDLGPFERRLGPSLDVDLGGAELVASALIRYPAEAGVEAASYLPVAWDDAAGGWMPTFDEVTLDDDGHVVVHTDRFSVRDIIVNNTHGDDTAFASQVSQTLGELFGTRSDGPDCGGVSTSPTWVAQFVAMTDNAAPIRVCTESTPADDLLVRVVNNRPYGITLQAQRPFVAPQADADPTGLVELVQGVIARAAESGPTSLYVPPLGEASFVVPRPADASEREWRAQSEISVATVLFDILITIVDVAEIPKVGPALDVLRAITVCVLDNTLATAVSEIDRALVRSIIDNLADCASLIRQPGEYFLTNELEESVRAGLISPELFRSLTNLATFFRALEIGRTVQKFLDIGVDLFFLDPPTISVFATQQSLDCVSILDLSYPDELLSELSGETRMDVYTFYDPERDRLDVYDVALHRPTSDVVWSFDDGDFVGTLAFDADYVATEFGGAAPIATVLGPDGTTGVCDAADLVAPVGFVDAWPVNRSDGEPAFWAYLGADFFFPSWVSCWDDVCLAGNSSVVRAYGTDPLGFLLEFSADADSPFNTLVSLGLNEEQARAFLAPTRPDG